MLAIGLTGGIGSGKSAVADCFQQRYGIDIIDTDVVARQVVEPETVALSTIQQKFGPTILTESGYLDRRALRDIIFAQPEQKQWLEQLLHPLIRQQVLQQVEQAQSAYVIVAIPLLVENGKYPFIDRVLVVDCHTALQLQRACQRDQMTVEQAQRIIDAQASRQQRLDMADDVIDNNSDLAALSQQVAKLHQYYLTLR